MTDVATTPAPAPTTSAAPAAAKPPIEFTFAALGPNKPFAVDALEKGETFGTTGHLTISGIAVPTSRWSPKAIRGVLPLGCREGDVTVTVMDGDHEVRTLHGVFTSQEARATEQAAARLKQTSVEAAAKK
jgi:hypothetical protein